MSDTAPDADHEAHERSEISYDEQFYPARPRRLRPRARLRGLFPRRRTEREGRPTGDNPAYVQWLKDESMLQDASEIGYAVNHTDADSTACRGSGLANGFCHMLPWPENCLANSTASESIDCSASQLT